MAACRPVSRPLLPSPIHPPRRLLPPLASLTTPQASSAPRTRSTARHGPADWNRPDSTPLHPRSAVEVLTGLSTKVNARRGDRVPADSPGADAARSNAGWRHPRGRADPDRWRSGLRQDDDVAPDRPQHRSERPGERAVHLLRARRGIPAQPHDGDGVGSRGHDAAVGQQRGQDPGRAPRSPGHVDGQGGDANADLRANPRLRPAVERISRYGQGLFLLRGSHTYTTPQNLRALVEGYRRSAPTRPLVVFVDYLQRVPIFPDPPTEAEKVTNVVAGLKDLALSLGVAVVCIVAADKEGLKAARLRNHHLRGSSALNYEADVILILNEKYQIVAKVNIEFNPYQAQRFRDWTILTVEKNRSGKDAVDLEYEKHFEYSCFDPNGRQVQEKLIEERLYND